MALNKLQRAALREKFGGLCAYCGHPLSVKWHADHIDPIIRNDWFKRAGISIPPRGPDYPHRDVLANMNPACPPCNIDKHSMSLEDWRGIIERSNDVLARDVSTFRRAVRYGLVTLESKPVVFYFEQYQSTPTEPPKEQP